MPDGARPYRERQRNGCFTRSREGAKGRRDNRSVNGEGIYVDLASGVPGHLAMPIVVARGAAHGTHDITPSA